MERREFQTKCGEKPQIYEIYFNVYRIETDGGETEKHLFALNPTGFPKFHVPSKFVLLNDYTKHNGE